MNFVDWQSKYQSGDVPWDKGVPSPGLVDFLQHHHDPHRSKKTVAVPGCGFGHDVRCWAEAGFRTTGFDIAPDAIEGAQKRTPSTLTRLARFTQADFLHSKPPQKFDWLFEHTLFCAIDPSQRSDYVRAASRWTKPGGFLLAIHYFLPPTQEGPPWSTDRDEILSRFNSDFSLLAEWIPRSYPNRTGLERLYWWRRKG